VRRRAWVANRRAVGGLLIALALAGCQARPGTVEGRVVSGGTGAAGVGVEAWLQAERVPGSSPFAVAQTDAEGGYVLTLPAGQYWLMARDRAPAGGPPRIAEIPGNPARVRAGETARAADAELARVGGEAAFGPGSGVRGRVLLGGEPAGGAAVMVYPPDRERLAGPGYLALVRSAPDGTFLVDLAPGSYRVAVRRRAGGEIAGRLREGDASAVLEEPVEVAGDGYRDFGDVELHLVDPQRLGSVAAPEVTPEGGTWLEGRVVDADGKPRPGFFVFIYRDSGMIGRPQAVAETGPDGGFVLALPGGGKYYVGARSARGGPRQPGEWSGLLAGTADGGLEVPRGRRLKGVVVTVGREW